MEETVVEVTFRGTPEALRRLFGGLPPAVFQAEIEEEGVEVRRTLPSQARMALSAPRAELTPREKEVLQLLAEGLTNKEIGERLERSENTARSHVWALMQKYNVKSRVKLALTAQQPGMLGS